MDGSKTWNRSTKKNITTRVRRDFEFEGAPKVYIRNPLIDVNT